MRPFGQWLNDCGGKAKVDPAYVDEFDEAVQANTPVTTPYIAPRPEGSVIARCERCFDEVDPRKFGMEPDQVTSKDRFICDCCMGGYSTAPRLDGDDEDWRD